MFCFLELARKQSKIKILFYGKGSSLEVIDFRKKLNLPLCLKNIDKPKLVYSPAKTFNKKYL